MGIGYTVLVSPILKPSHHKATLQMLLYMSALPDGIFRYNLWVILFSMNKACDTAFEHFMTVKDYDSTSPILLSTLALINTILFTEYIPLDPVIPHIVEYWLPVGACLYTARSPPAQIQCCKLPGLQSSIGLTEDAVT